jgi:hypothetical protein
MFSGLQKAFVPKLFGTNELSKTIKGSETFLNRDIQKIR